jgi:hypothetical protein
MSKEFSRISIEHLCSWILKEYDETQQIFGIHKDLFFTPRANDPFTMNRYGQFMETPIGVAAGPHTQMAQNLIAAWLCGSRYLELKTCRRSTNSSQQAMHSTSGRVTTANGTGTAPRRLFRRLSQRLDHAAPASPQVRLAANAAAASSSTCASATPRRNLKIERADLLERMNDSSAQLKENCRHYARSTRKLTKSIFGTASDNITLSAMHAARR